MQGLPPCGLLDLLPATKAVRDDQRVIRRLANRGKNHPLPHPHRHVVVLLLEAERSGHAATSRVRMLEIEPDSPQHRFLRVETHHRLVMAMRLNERLALE